MAIEITPKPKIKIPIWLIILGVVDLILLVAFLGSYFYLERSIKQISQEIQEKDLAAGPLEKAITEKERELRPFQQKINDFGTLISAHKKPLDVFGVLEKICLPNVWFSNFSFSFEGDGTGKVAVSGQTDSFLTLEHQIFILKQEPLIKNFTIGGVSITEEGEVNFSLSLAIDPKIFR